MFLYMPCIWIHVSFNYAKRLSLCFVQALCLNSCLVQLYQESFPVFVFRPCVWIHVSSNYTKSLSLCLCSGLVFECMSRSIIPRGFPYRSIIPKGFPYVNVQALYLNACLVQLYQEAFPETFEVGVDRQRLELCSTRESFIAHSHSLDSTRCASGRGKTVYLQFKCLSYFKVTIY